MTANDSAADKSIVNQLDFSTRTGKRVAWEQFEFTVDGPHLVRVTNASYGYLKDDHSYTVGVADRDGQLIPVECNCPADRHHDSDCKHKVALALCGGPMVMQAAADYQLSGSNEVPQGVRTAADKLRADGGDSALYESNHKECDCGTFPCWPCVQAGRREIPE